MNKNKRSMFLLRFCSCLIILFTAYCSKKQEINRQDFFTLVPVKSYGIPAPPGPSIYIQPDSTRVTIYTEGDAAVSWGESIDGYAIIINKGYVEYAITSTGDSIIPSGIRVSPDSTEKTPAEIDFIAKAKKGCPYSDSAFKAKRARYLEIMYPGD